MATAERFEAGPGDFLVLGQVQELPSREIVSGELESDDGCAAVLFPSLYRGDVERARGRRHAGAESSEGDPERQHLLAHGELAQRMREHFVRRLLRCSCRIVTTWLVPSATAALQLRGSSNAASSSGSGSTGGNGGSVVLFADDEPDRDLVLAEEFDG